MIRIYKEEKIEGIDFYTALQQTSTQLLPKPVARLFSTEIAVVYYALFKWKKRALKENEFSYHKKSGTPALLGAMIFIVAVETFVLHILLESWNPIMAWVLSGLSIYTLLQILGFAKALGQRPIQINNEYLYLNYGILAEAKIPLEAIISIELIENDEKRGVQLSPLGDFETANLMIQLNEEITVHKLYRKQEKTNIIRFFADDAEH
ncbi:MAG: hypothetical protein MK212_06525 [Saprospiraceae bacterium]|nr:hypothetical protein [Saprospiraceae bacterium]